MEPNEVTAQMVDAACLIHTRLGPGLLETAYEVTVVVDGLPEPSGTLEEIE